MKKFTITLVLSALIIAAGFAGACDKSAASESSVTEEEPTEPAVKEDVPNTQEGNSNSNIQNRGRMTYDDDYMYFLYQKDNWVDDYENYSFDIIRSEKDGSNAEVLTSTIIQGELNISNGVLYGPAYGKTGSELHAIGIESGDDSIIIEKEWTYNMRIIGDRIYYSNGSSVISANLDGEDKKVIFAGPDPIETDGGLIDSLGDIAVRGDEIYYVTNLFDENKGYYTALNKINIDSGKTEILFEGYEIKNIQFIGDDLYYLDTDPDNDNMQFLYRNGEKVMTDKQIYGYSVAENAIVYYTKESDNDEGLNIYRCDFDYSNSKLIMKQDGYQTGINIVGNDMFLQDGNIIEMIDLDTLERKEVASFPSGE
jgi:hypothetical protein